MPTHVHCRRSASAASTWAKMTSITSLFALTACVATLTEVAALTMRTTGGQNFKAYVFINENAV